MKRTLNILAAITLVFAFGTAFAFVGTASAEEMGKTMRSADSLINYLDPSNAGFDAQFGVVARGSAAGGIVPVHDTFLTDIGAAPEPMLSGPVSPTKEGILKERENVLY